MTILVVNGQTNQTNVKRSFYNTATGINRSGFHRFDSVAYLLWDIFNTSRAAGGVNGTAAEPGPDVRTVVDTGGIASIAGGVFTVSGNTSAGDPRLDEGSCARTFGRVFLLTTGNLSNQELFFGLSNNATPSATTGAPYFKSTGTTLRVVSTSGTARTVGAQADYTRYAIIARATGGYLFGRLAAGGWRLLSIEAVDSTATILPAVVCAVKTGALFSLDDWKTPAILWVVPCLAYDTFTRADGVLGVSEYTGPDGQAASVRTWTGATWTVSSNKAVNAPTLGDELATGNLVIGTWYSITATQANYFYAGCAIGNTFRAVATTALDANNKVKAIAPATLPAFCGDLGTPDVLASADLTFATGTQAGLLFNSDSTFHARINNAAGYEAGATEIVLDAVTKAITSSDTVTIAGTTYTIASVGSLSGQVQTITLSGGGLSAPVADDLDIGVNYATPNFLLPYHNSTNAKLDKCVNGTFTTLISVAATYSAEATLRLITYTSGGNLLARLYYANAFIGSEQTISDAGIVTNKIHGLFGTSSGNTLDNFTVFPRGSNSEYAILDTF